MVVHTQVCRWGTDEADVCLYNFLLDLSHPELDPHLPLLQNPLYIQLKPGSLATIIYHPSEYESVLYSH